MTRTVALDLPSGIHTDTGHVLGGASDEGERAPKVMLTVTFHSEKLAHRLGQGPDDCGRVVVIDIGLPHGLRRDTVQLAERCDGSVLKEPRGGEHKFGYGHAFILSGGIGHGGAARMAARGALRIGAGLVTLGCPPAALIENAAQLNAIMLRSVKDADALAGVLGDPRINALCLGPGLGTGLREALLVRAALGAVGENHPPYTVLDGDALTLIARDPDLFAMLHDKCVLTPHGGEFARLFPDIAERLSQTPTEGPAYSKVDATRDAAKRAGCTVLFKGPDTVIANADGSASIQSAHYERAVPWLATAGAGDVLAGFISGLLARGFEPKSAAERAAWLHVECALSFGPGLIAEDLPDQLPYVLRGLQAKVVSGGR